MNFIELKTYNPLGNCITTTYLNLDKVDYFEINNGFYEFIIGGVKTGKCIAWFDLKKIMDMKKVHKGGRTWKTVNELK